MIHHRGAEEVLGELRGQQAADHLWFRVLASCPMGVNVDCSGPYLFLGMFGCGQQFRQHPPVHRVFGDVVSLLVILIDLFPGGP